MPASVHSQLAALQEQKETTRQQRQQILNKATGILPDQDLFGVSIIAFFIALIGAKLKESLNKQ